MMDWTRLNARRQMMKLGVLGFEDRSERDA